MKVCVCNNISHKDLEKAIINGYTYEKFVAEFRKHGCKTCDNLIIKTLTNFEGRCRIDYDNN